MRKYSKIQFQCQNQRRAHQEADREYCRRIHREMMGESQRERILCRNSPRKMSTPVVSTVNATKTINAILFTCAQLARNIKERIASHLIN